MGWRVVDALSPVLPIFHCSRVLREKTLVFWDIGCFLCEVTPMTHVFQKLMCLGVHAWVSVCYMYSGACRGQSALGSPHNWSYKVVSHMMWVLGTQPRSSERAIASNHLAISPVPHNNVFFFFFLNWHSLFLGSCYISWLSYVLASFVSTWHKVKSSETREPQLRNVFIRRA